MSVNNLQSSLKSGQKIELNNNTNGTISRVWNNSVEIKLEDGTVKFVSIDNPIFDNLRKDDAYETYKENSKKWYNHLCDELDNAVLTYKRAVSALNENRIEKNKFLSQKGYTSEDFEKSSGISSKDRATWDGLINEGSKIKKTKSGASFDTIFYAMQASSEALKQGRFV